MLIKKTTNGKKRYGCEMCKMFYHNRRLAEKCEKFCKKQDGDTSKSFIHWRPMRDSATSKRLSAQKDEQARGEK